MRTAPLDDPTLATPLRLRTLKSATHRLATIVADRRRHRRVAVTLFGRFMRENREEYPCQVIQMSAGSMSILAPVKCEEGERIIAYLDHVGRRGDRGQADRRGICLAHLGERRQA
jgi:hypothetical protein